MRSVIAQVWLLLVVGGARVERVVAAVYDHQVADFEATHLNDD